MIALIASGLLAEPHVPLAALGPRTSPAVRLFVGGDGTYVGGRRLTLDGDRAFSAAVRSRSSVTDTARVCALLDSGAFSDAPAARLTPAGALARQLAWERTAARLWRGPFQAHALVSYDRLIDETWVAGVRHKRRWSVPAADAAVAETVAAAAYLASRREHLAPRTLVLSTQGVDAGQYDECVAAVLRVATPADWIGLGGWCILGRWRSWLPTFWATLRLVLPRIAAAHVAHVHIFGVLYPPALGGLVWLADQHGLTVSSDSSAPVLSAVYTTPAKRKKAGCRGETWEANVAYWRATLAHLRDTPHYREPPRVPALRQLWLFD